MARRLMTAHRRLAPTKSRTDSLGTARAALIRHYESPFLFEMQLQMWMDRNADGTRHSVVSAIAIDDAQADLSRNIFLEPSAVLRTMKLIFTIRDISMPYVSSAGKLTATGAGTRKERLATAIPGLLREREPPWLAAGAAVESHRLYWGMPILLSPRTCRSARAKSSFL
jgi:hypothetical protein